MRLGGVMRCCIQTEREIGPPAAMLTEGDTLPCTYCPSGLVWSNGAWEWWGPDFMLRDGEGGEG